MTEWSLSIKPVQHAEMPSNFRVFSCLGAKLVLRVVSFSSHNEPQEDKKRSECRQCMAPPVVGTSCCCLTDEIACGPVRFKVVVSLRRDEPTMWLSAQQTNAASGTTFIDECIDQPNSLALSTWERPGTSQRSVMATIATARCWTGARHRVRCCEY